MSPLAIFPMGDGVISMHLYSLSTHCMHPHIVTTAGSLADRILLGGSRSGEWR